MKDLLQAKLKASISYDEFIADLKSFVERGITSGPVQNEELVGHTKMSLQRINKWEKIAKIDSVLTEKLESLKLDQTWLLIVESWCGDVGQNIVPIKKIADLLRVDLQIVYRDENLDLMDEFLTNGGRAIPILIMIDNATWSVKGVWGPRPLFIQNWFAEEKQKPEFSKEAALGYVHLWYAKNKHEELQKEILYVLTS